MGRAIVRKPALFLFDEPLSNLDAKLRVQMRAEIKALQDKVRTTSIYVTHDQIEAMTLADRIVVLRKGQIEQQGTPLELYRRPANVFVAGFIGTPAMNFLSGTVRLGGKFPLVELADGATLRIASGLRIKDRQSVFIGLRPEHLSLSKTGGIAARVRLVEPTGAQTHLIVDFAGQDAVVVVDGGVIVAKNTMVRLAISPALIHVFDSETESRLNAGVD